MSKRFLASLGVVLALAGCGYTDPLTKQTTTAQTTEAGGQTPVAPVVVHDQGLPPDAAPMGRKGDQQPCPYLDSDWVADTNGQKVTGSSVDTRFDTPACVFWSYPEEPQVQVVVRHFNTQDEAIASVDAWAPVDTTNPASLPAGWEGGRGGWDDHAVFAVFKNERSVIVLTNQGQSVKAEQIAAETINRLGL